MRIESCAESTPHHWNVKHGEIVDMNGIRHEICQLVRWYPRTNPRVPPHTPLRYGNKDINAASVRWKCALCNLYRSCKLRVEDAAPRQIGAWKQVCH